MTGAVSYRWSDTDVRDYPVTCLWFGSWSGSCGTSRRLLLSWSVSRTPGPGLSRVGGNPLQCHWGSPVKPFRGRFVPQWKVPALRPLTRRLWVQLLLLSFLFPKVYGEGVPRPCMSRIRNKQNFRPLFPRPPFRSTLIKSTSKVRSRPS